MLSIVGHDKRKKYFNHVITNNMLSHAYLFTGPDMIGKKMFAFELAENILGNDIWQNPDFKLIAPKVDDGESKIYIEDIRDLKKFSSLKSYNGGWRVVIFDDAHCLTPEAANAFLKVLEEPSAGSLIILISSVPGLILPTILSRCEEVRFMAADEKEISNYLAGLACRQAGKKIKNEDKEFLVKLAGGRIGLIDRLIQENGISEARKAVDDLRKLLASGIFEKMNYAKKVHEVGDYRPKVVYWLNWVSAHVATSPKNEKIVKNLLSLHQLVSQPQFNHRLALENFLLNL